jgi:energy-coupling factor transporter ATP-binding protein EcfA2
MNNIKTILLIGRTGNGKSTLANVLLGERDERGNFKEVFGESVGSISKTKKIQIEKFVDKEVGAEYRIIDTVGIGDTEMTLDKVLRKLALMGYSVKDGLSQILFVTDGQLAKEAKSTYDLLEQVVFDEKIAKYTTVLRTRFASFRSDEDCEKEKKKMIENSEGLKSLVERCNKVVFVDNPPIDIDDEDLAKLYSRRREDSRRKLLEHLSSVCQDDTYRPANLIILSSEIGKYMVEKDELKKVKQGELEKEKAKEFEEKKSEKESKILNPINVVSAGIKDIKEERKNKLLNERITEAMLEHIGNIDWELKKSIEEHLKKLEEEKETKKGKKPAKWGIIGGFAGKVGSSESLEAIKQELEKREQKAKNELTDAINYAKNGLDEKDLEIEIVMSKANDLKEKLDDVLAKKLKIIQIESQLDKLRQFSKPEPNNVLLKTKQKEIELESLVKLAKDKLKGSSIFSIRSADKNKELESFFKDFPTNQVEFVKNLEKIKKDLSKKITPEEINSICRIKKELEQLRLSSQGEKQLQTPLSKVED